MACGPLAVTTGVPAARHSRMPRLAMNELTLPMLVGTARSASGVTLLKVTFVLSMSPVSNISFLAFHQLHQASGVAPGFCPVASSNAAKMRPLRAWVYSFCLAIDGSCRFALVGW